MVIDWEAFPGADFGYAVEVIDVYGSLAWGGFQDAATPDFVIDSGTTSVEYGEETWGGEQAAPLVAGRFYRARVYALGTDGDAPGGFRILSVSEEKQGRFRRARPGG